MRLLYAIIFILSCCAQPAEQKVQAVRSSLPNDQVSENLVDLLYGNPVRFDSLKTNYERALYYLNRSDYKACLRLLQSEAVLSKQYYNGYWGYDLNLVSPSKILAYSLFRYENFLGNLPRDRQIEMLLSASYRENTDVYVLEELEHAYLSAESTITNVLLKARQFLKAQNKDAFRVKFLIANLEFRRGNASDALIIFDELIANDYWALICLRTVLIYYEDRDKALWDKYYKLYRRKFSEECPIVIDITKRRPLKFDDVVVRCSQSFFQVDSITTEILYANELLKKRDFVSLEKALDYYFVSNTQYISDSLLLYERGVYFDLKLRSLFLQKRYGNMCEFMQGMGINGYIEFSNDKDVFDYVRKVVIEYKVELKDLQGFLESNLIQCF